MISVVALSGESLVAGGAPEAVVICVGLLMLEHVSPAAERLLTEQTLVGFDTWRRDDFISQWQSYTRSAHLVSQTRKLTVICWMNMEELLPICIFKCVCLYIF